MPIEVVTGDLLDQPVDAIVNAWNRNVIPWWPLLPRGVSGAIKKRGGIQPFREVARHGPIPLGGAGPHVPLGGFRSGASSTSRASTCSGAHPSARSAAPVRSAMSIVAEQGLPLPVASPLIGAGSGGFSADRARKVMQDELGRIDADVRVVLVRYDR